MSNPGIELSLIVYINNRAQYLGSTQHRTAYTHTSSITERYCIIKDSVISTSMLNYDTNNKETATRTLAAN
jgi:hypothetical protein